MIILEDSLSRPLLSASESRVRSHLELGVHPVYTFFLLRLCSISGLAPLWGFWCGQVHLSCVQSRACVTHRGFVFKYMFPFQSFKLLLSYPVVSDSHPSTCCFNFLLRNTIFSSFWWDGHYSFLFLLEERKCADFKAFFGSPARSSGCWPL